MPQSLKLQHHILKREKDGRKKVNMSSFVKRLTASVILDVRGLFGASQFESQGRWPSCWIWWEPVVVRSPHIQNVCCCRDTVCKHLRCTRSPSSTKTACLWLFKAERKCAPLWSSSAVNLFVLQIVFYQEYCYCYFLKIAKNHELSNCASFLQRNMELIKELIWKQTVNTIKILLDLELEYFKWEAQVLSFLYHPYFSLLRRKVCGRCMRIQNVIQD